MKRTLLVLPLLAVVATIAACGSSSSTPASSTATLSMSISQSDSQVLTSLSKGTLSISKAAVDLSTYSISCKDGAGTEYTSTIAGTTTGTASVPNIPTGTPVVCYLLNSSGTPVTQLTISDTTNVLGGQYDAPKLSANATNTVVFNPIAGGAVVTPDANTTINSTGTAVDPTGSYSMTCVGVFNEVTDAENATYSTTYCNQFASQGNTQVYMHRISATQNSANTVYGVGAWRSQDAFVKCGSTEGIDNIPSGMTLADSTQATAFSWDTYFSTFTKTSTTDEIANMIEAFGNAYGATLGQTYTAYSQLTEEQGGLCAWMNQEGAPTITDAQKKAMCSSMYYWQVVDQYLNSSPASYCVPLVNATWSTTNNNPTVTLSAKAGLASHTAPMNRFDFMPLQFLTDALENNIGRMSSKEFWTFSAYNGATQTSVDCIKTVNMLIQFNIPTTEPVTGTQITTSFNTDSAVVSQDGNAAKTALCESAEGNSIEMAPNGYYLRVIMTKQ